MSAPTLFHKVTDPEKRIKGGVRRTERGSWGHGPWNIVREKSIALGCCPFRICNVIPSLVTAAPECGVLESHIHT